MNMKTAYLYCDKRSLNDASNFYIKIIAKRIEADNFFFKTVNALSDIQHPDLILTVTEKYYLLAKLRYPRTKHIYWSQGIGPEEQFGRWHAVVFRTIAEFLAVRTSDILYMVSYAMCDHFAKKYGYKKNNYVVMPCFNISKPNTIVLEKFTCPTFVYAGGMAIWQCIDQTLDTYKIVEDSLPSAKLIILSNAQKEFTEKIKSRGIKNYIVKYVKKDNLADELSKYKYGFLLREDNPVNNVATPTKMNGYLASHLIPIYTDAIRDYNSILDLGDFAIKVSCPFTPKEVADAIINFEKKQINCDAFGRVIDNIFETYYNEKYYQSKIDESLRKLLK